MKITKRQFRRIIREVMMPDIPDVFDTVNFSVDGDINVVN
jgi:predicted PilT family ATPase